AWLESRVMPRSDIVLTTTAMRAKFFARAYGIGRPLVLQNRPRHQPVESAARIRRELRLPADKLIVLYQGGFQAGRGLESLVRVALLLPEAYFVFIGSGKLESRLKELADELELNGRVHFIPMVPVAELPSYTVSADIGMQPLENTCFNHFTTDSNKL